MAPNSELVKNNIQVFPQSEFSHSSTLPIIKLKTNRLVYVGIALWLSAYALMAIIIHRHPGTVVWPLVPWAMYDLVWEWFDACNLLGGQRVFIKRFLHLGYALLDTYLVWEQIQAQPIQALLSGTFFSILALSFPRDYKYGNFAWHFFVHYATATLPAYRMYPELRAAIWLQTLANVCYIPKGDDAPPYSRTFYRIVARLLPLWGIFINLIVVERAWLWRTVE